MEDEQAGILDAPQRIPSERKITNSSYLCTPSSTTAVNFRMVEPWNSHNSTGATPENCHSRLPSGLASNVAIATDTKSRVVPTVMLKPREVPCNLSRQDQDSMEDEILQMKRALLEKEMELRRQKVHAANVEAESRKLAKDIEALEVISNLEGPFMGSPRRLRAKIAGVEAKRTGTPFAEGRLGMLEEAYNTCESQAIELDELRRDVRLTHARELEVERSVYAAEVRRLQQVVKNLKSVNGRIGLENRAARHLKAKNHHLEVMNLFLSSCLSASLRQTPRIPRTTKTPARRDALIENSFVDLDDVQQRRVPPPPSMHHHIALDHNPQCQLSLGNCSFSCKTWCYTDPKFHHKSTEKWFVEQEQGYFYRWITTHKNSSVKIALPSDEFALHYILSVALDKYAAAPVHIVMRTSSLVKRNLSFSLRVPSKDDVEPMRLQSSTISAAPETYFQEQVRC
uniref:Uncharacterized protein n=1 Tax=Physcomitrium patens TaxID=3218 RepID=A0A2K1KAW0_PHYPA|nr:hypothetical protein PHYPA_010098 [Physcomitrium patens]